jgi:hypothetical protein
LADLRVGEMVFDDTDTVLPTARIQIADNDKVVRSGEVKEVTLIQRMPTAVAKKILYPSDMLIPSPVKHGFRWNRLHIPYSYKGAQHILNVPYGVYYSAGLKVGQIKASGAKIGG